MPWGETSRGKTLPYRLKTRAFQNVKFVNRRIRFNTRVLENEGKLHEFLFAIIYRLDLINKWKSFSTIFFS